MTFTLSKTIQTGQRIKTTKGWRKVKEVTDTGAVVKDGLVKFGDTVFGWKAN